MHQNPDQGIYVDPTPITAGEKVVVKYDGLLAKSGAQGVYLHTGFGQNNHWDRVMDLRMSKDGDQWQTDLEVNTDDRLNICFHDSANNWDNNSGMNWSFEVHNGDLY